MKNATHPIDKTISGALVTTSSLWSLNPSVFRGSFFPVTKLLLPIMESIKTYLTNILGGFQIRHLRIGFRASPLMFSVSLWIIKLNV
jgi:hypothetical protein